MNRVKILATLIATLVAFAALPAMPALAAANSTAQLTSARSLLPGDSVATLQVTNTETGSIIAPGKAITKINVHLPLGAGITVKNPAAPGTAGAFTPKYFKAGNQETVQFTGSSLAAGSSLTISIPINARASSGCQAVGDWVIETSSDTTNGRPSTATGNGLRSDVQMLEIVAASLKPVAPTNADNTRGVTDGSATAGQLVTYEYTVKNHATAALTVSGELTSSASQDQPRATAAVSVPAGQTAPIRPEIQLGEASSQRSTTLSAIATAASTKLNGAPCTTTSAPVQHTLTVQVPSSLSFVTTSLQPLRVRSGEGSATTFKINASKIGGAAFDLQDGALTFATNNAVLQGASAGSPKTYGAGNQPASELQFAIAQIAGGNGDYNANIRYSGIDHNLAPVNQSVNVGTIVIDLLGPILDIVKVTLPIDPDGDQQVAIKNGDTVVVTGTIKTAILTNPSGPDIKPGTLRICLNPNSGASKCVTPSTTQTADGATFSATFSGTNSTMTGATDFSVSGEVADHAGNPGSDVDLTRYFVDNVFAKLAGQDPLNAQTGVVTSPTTISVRWYDNITVFDNVRGGCDIGSWTIDGRPQLVTRIDAKIGSSFYRCDGPDTGAANNTNPEWVRRQLSDGTRVLTLRQEAAQSAHSEPRVGYNPNIPGRSLGGYPAKDGAYNNSLEEVVNTVSQVAPPLPNVTLFERKDHVTGAFETAYLDTTENKRYTNNPAANALRFTWSFTTPTNPAPNAPLPAYKIRVTDANGTTLKEQAAGTQNPVSGEWTGTIEFAVAATATPADGDHLLRLYVVSPRGTLSAPASYTFVLDRALPTIGSSTFNGTNTVAVTMAEKIVAGSNIFDDWQIGYTVDTADGTDTAYRSANTVTKVNDTTWNLAVTLADPTRYVGAYYQIRNATSQRYEDRAGNYMLDTL